MFGLKKKKKTEAEVRREIEEDVMAQMRENIMVEMGRTYRGYLSDGTRYIATLDEPEPSDLDLTVTIHDLDLGA